MTMNGQQNDPRDLWQADAQGSGRVSAGDLQVRIERLARATRRRNIGGFVVCAVVLAICAWFFQWLNDPIARLGSVLTAIGVATLAFLLRRIQADEQDANRRASQMGATASIDFHRAELRRQRDFHRGAPLWFRVLLFVPGPQLLFLGFARAHPEVAATIRLIAIASVLMLVAAFPVNMWLARGYQRQIDQLSRF